MNHSLYCLMESVSLYELNSRIRHSVEEAFPSPVWVRAEISELKENANGHAYLELVEKDGNRIVAKTKAMCWRNTYAMLKPFFREKTGQPLAVGMKVLFACEVNFHEQYGFSLLINDVDPAFTLGDMARQRQETIQRLRQEGVFDMNRSLTVPPLPQRIAVISSATAAGFGDFEHQLKRNEQGYVFYTHLFPAVMQGERTSSSIIAALERIYVHAELFDVVVIIRGGGATADLNSFDNYELATNCAQFPLPIITGIGHLRDTCVLDMVANVCAKTPTAVAEYLINSVASEDLGLSRLFERLRQGTSAFLQERNNDVIMRSYALHRCASDVFGLCQRHILLRQQRLRERSSALVLSQRHRIEMMEKDLQMNSPLEMMRRGFAVVTRDGKKVASASSLYKGDKVELYFHDGSRSASVTE